MIFRVKCYFYTNISVIIGLVIGLAVVLIGIVCIAVLICHYRNKDKEKKAPPPPPVGSDDINSPYGTVQAWYPDYKTETSKYAEGGTL